MWCSSCQQDVPGIASPSDGALCCPRCNREVEAAALPDGGARKERKHASCAASRTGAPLVDLWELEQDLGHIERTLYLGGHSDRRAKRIYRREAVRYDVAHAAVPAWHVPLKAEIQRRKRKRPEASRRGGVMAAVMWLAFAAGTTALFCGGALLVWSVVSNRLDLWNMGLPTTLGGQIGLLLAIGFRLERLWRENRAAAADAAATPSAKRSPRARKHLANRRVASGNRR